MRLFEILTLTSLLLTLVSFFVPSHKRPRWSGFLPTLPVLFVLAHLAVEGYRWQMVPTYGLAAVLFTATLRSLLLGREGPSPVASRKRKVLKHTGIVLGLLVLITAAIPPVLFPVFTLPAPTGPHAIGTTHFVFIDTDRPDNYAADPGAYRQLSMRVWYPAEPETDQKPVPYMSKEEAIFTNTQVGVPPFLLSHYPLIRTHSYREAQPKSEGSPYPVILYSPSGQITQNTVLFEELASHGYVVISVGHPYWNAFYYDAEGHVIALDVNNAHYKALWEEENASIVNAIKEEITTATTLAEKEEAQRRLNQHLPEEVNDVRLWSDDLSFLIDELEKLNRGSGVFAGKLDLGHIGVVGFSKGGVAAGQFCVSDPRCMAGINLSGFMFGDIVERNLSQPFMIMENVEPWCEDCLPINDLFYENAENSAYLVQIKDAGHGNFCDWSLAGWWLRRLGILGPIDGYRFLKIQNDYVLAFFDKHLRGLSAPLLEGAASDYAEVKFKSR